MRSLAALVVWGAVLLGGTGTVVAVGARRRSDGVFRYEQSRSLSLMPSTVLAAAGIQAGVAKAREPLAPVRCTPYVQVRFRPRRGGTPRNRWSFAIRYRPDTRAHYSAVVQPDDHYTGVGIGIITGCCVEAPTLD
jgi:hypothetical protein